MYDNLLTVALSLTGSHQQSTQLIYTSNLLISHQGLLFLCSMHEEHNTSHQPITYLTGLDTGQDPEEARQGVLGSA